MRCMLTSNLAVDQRFANGTQGRLLLVTRRRGGVETGRARFASGNYGQILERILRAKARPASAGYRHDGYPRTTRKFEHSRRTDNAPTAPGAGLRLDRS